MSRSIKLLAVAVLAVVLALSSAQNAFAVTELVYDSGVAWGGLAAAFTGVRFSLPGGVASAQLAYIRFDWAFIGVNDVRVHITGPDHQTLLTPSILVPLTGTGVGCPAGWGGCSGLAVSVTVTGDFYVVLEMLGGGNVLYDDDGNSGRSFYGPSLAGLTSPDNFGDYLIRVDIDPILPSAAPVGGLIQPVNKLTIAAPYLAFFGVIAAVAVVVWKKREN